jgi:hypothetical protein
VPGHRLACTCDSLGLPGPEPGPRPDLAAAWTWACPVTCVGLGRVYFYSSGMFRANLVCDKPVRLRLGWAELVSAVPGMVWPWPGLAIMWSWVQLGCAGHKLL